MNKLIEYFAKQHTFVNLLTAFVMIAGIYSILKIRRESFPNVSFDMLTVTTIYPNASAESVESLITTPLESDLLEIEGVKEMTSVSVESRSVIVLKLDPDQVEVDEAEADVQDVVDKFKELPDAAEDPLVTATENKSMPLIEISLFSKLPLEELRKDVKLVKRKLERLSGVASVNYKGLPKYEIKVEAIPSKIRRYKVGLTEIVNALRGANIDVPAGNITFEEDGKKRDFVLKTQIEAEDVDSIENVILRSTITEKFIRIKDVAKVSYGFADQDIWYRTNGENGINLVVLKQTSADTIRLVDLIKNAMKQIKTDLPDEIQYSYLNDQSKNVRRRVNVLANNLVVGLVLVLLILSIMLPIRVALVAAVGIPFSFLATIMIFDYGEVSLNLISMMGLIIVLGMLVDDAVVVTENAQRKLDEGLDPESAAIEGTQEIWKPVLSSIATTLAAFIPLMLMSGIFGKFIKYLPVGVVIALIVSLFECFFILPSHISSWVSQPKRPKGKFNVNYLWNEYALPTYVTCIHICMKLRYLIALSIVALVGFSINFAVKKMDFVFFPGTQAKRFTIKYELPIGTRLSENEQVVQSIENIVREVCGNDLADFVTQIGSKQFGSRSMSRNTIGSHYGQVKVYLIEDQELTKSVDSMIEEIKKKGKSIAGIEKFDLNKGRSGPPVGKAVSIKVFAEDYEKVNQAVDVIKAELTAIEGMTSISDSNTPGKEEIVVKLDQRALSLASLSKLDVANAVRATYDGIIVDNIQQFDEEIDIRVTLSEDNKDGLESLGNTLIPNQRGRLIRLKSVAKFERGTSLGSLEHIDAYRSVKVEAEVNESIITSSKANEIMRDKIAEIRKQIPGLSFKFGGEEQDRVESFKSLRTTFTIAIIVIVLILLLQFNNLYQPLIIGMVVPLGLLSVIWTFYFHNMPLSFLGVIGMIALAGVIVNNAIVFMDFVNKERQLGCTRKEAIINASKSRLRPIFLTTVTTTAGILPTAYGVGGIDRFVVPIALALGWGMFFGSFLTTIVLPVILHIFDDIIDIVSYPLKKFRQGKQT
ncbi:MAG: efflux RND transporter permease subunit [Oligoflexales bacterium]